MISFYWLSSLVLHYGRHNHQSSQLNKNLIDKVDLLEFGRLTNTFIGLCKKKRVRAKI